MTHTLSAKSITRLSTCHHDLQVIVNDVAKTHRLQVICGARQQIDQRAAFKNNQSKLDWPNSNHNVDGVKRTTSWAVDLAPLTEGGQIDWQDKAAFAKFARYFLATARALLAQGLISHAVRWGGDWDGDGEWTDERFLDMPHFELLGVNHGE